jgi:hypothetical protein
MLQHLGAMAECMRQGLIRNPHSTAIELPTRAAMQVHYQCAAYSLPIAPRERSLKSRHSPVTFKGPKTQDLTVAAYADSLT